MFHTQIISQHNDTFSSFKCMGLNTVTVTVSLVLGKMLLHWLSQNKNTSQIWTWTKSSSNIRCQMFPWMMEMPPHNHWRERPASLTHHRYICDDVRKARHKKNEKPGFTLVTVLFVDWLRLIAMWVCWLRVTLKNDKTTPQNLERGSLWPLDIYTVGNTAISTNYHYSYIGVTLFKAGYQKCDMGGTN